MDKIELFFVTWKNTAWAFFSFVAFVVAMGKILFMLRTLYKDHVDKMVEKALLNQRHEFQAQYFDVGEERFDKMLNRYDKCRDEYHALSTKMIEHEIDHKKAS